MALNLPLELHGYVEALIRNTLSGKTIIIKTRGKNFGYDQSPSEDYTETMNIDLVTKITNIFFPAYSHGLAYLALDQYEWDYLVVCLGLPSASLMNARYILVNNENKLSMAFNDGVHLISHN